MFLSSLSETGFSIHHIPDFSDSYEKPAWLRPYQLPRDVCFFPTVPVTNQNADSQLALRLSSALKAISEIHPTDRLLVYGAGTLAEAIVPLIQQNVSLVADQNEELHGRQWMDMMVQNPEKLPEFLNDFDTLLITPLGRETEIIANLRRILGDRVKQLKIITLDSGVTQGRSLETHKVNFALRNAPHSDTHKVNFALRNESPSLDTHKVNFALRNDRETHKVNFALRNDRETHKVNFALRNERPSLETHKVNFALRNDRELTRRGVLYVGYVCNIRCVFCYYAYKPAKKWHSLEECKQDATLYRTAYGNEQVDITGGEPTIYPHVLELAEHCREIGLRPSLITNAIILANMEKLRELRDHGVHDFLCSVHGLGDVYESITNRQGLWSKLTRAMANLDKAEMKWRANCTMTAINKHQLKEIAEFVFQNGARIINFISYNPFYEWAAKTDIDFQARHSEIAPYLAEALEYCDEAGLEANVRYYPFCLTKGHEEKCHNYSQLSYDPHEWDFCSWFSEKTKNPSSKMPYYFNLMADNKEELHLFFAQKTKHVSYFRNQICAGCSMGFLCDGFTNQYAGRFGIGEMRPHTGDYITDPAHFIIRQRKVDD